MPQLDVTEYSNLAADNLGRVIMAGQEPPMAVQPQTGATGTGGLILSAGTLMSR